LDWIDEASALVAKELTHRLRPGGPWEDVQPRSLEEAVAGLVRFLLMSFDSQLGTEAACFLGVFAHRLPGLIVKTLQGSFGVRLGAYDEQCWRVRLAMRRFLDEGVGDTAQTPRFEGVPDGLQDGRRRQ
jgi:hypothetical protein